MGVKTRAPGSKRNHLRETIAQIAARILAQDGSQDYASAKRKAARQAGAADTHSLPSNSEIDDALRTYHDLYQKDEHRERLRNLRQQALATMQLFAQFNPRLTGSVLAGTAARHSDINLQLFTDNLKEVEHFLLNRQIPYRQGEKRLRSAEGLRTVPSFTLEGEHAAVELAVLSSADLRTASHDGRPIERAKLEQVAALLAQA